MTRRLDDMIDGARASQSWLFRDRDRVILKGLEDERAKR